MLPLQDVSSLLVVEGLDVPLDQREILAIVLGVAASTLLAGTGRKVIGGVQSSPSGQPRGDFCMTIETLQRSLATELVATRAICRSAELLVRSRQWSRRNLCGTERCENEDGKKEERYDNPNTRCDAPLAAGLRLHPIVVVPVRTRHSASQG